jgi:hypothetical protein
MSQYHPDADPQFVAMTSHYEAQSSDLRFAVFNASKELDLISRLDSEIDDFYYTLWKFGYKIVPVATPTDPPTTRDEQPKYGLPQPVPND